MRLGALLAGGRSRRFGTDKALARLNGQTLLDHAAHALAAYCDSVVVIGHEASGYRTLPDWPRAGLGPLGGLAAALRHAAGHGHGEVLAIPVDCLTLPAPLVDRLSPGPACLTGQPVIGVWPAALADAIDAFVRTDPRRSMRGFATKVGARMIESDFVPPNINTPDDLARMTPGWRLS
ncbi:molybdenum cofactor guanylyltransferase [Sphingomonas sp.]|uniref:molybdenum cofactor guanylyltransferase n=1 Tax=Sphingomonas sp. TaxID=28214 RepID=UPI001EB582E6|nr:molybdenum cofactor guanylyltransferase [Sphingomonas sp.]MBX3593270.1 molybdenum cofactor guanylyltransferase [Sphingomonas sp.]